MKSKHFIQKNIKYSRKYPHFLPECHYKRAEKCCLNTLFPVFTKCKRIAISPYTLNYDFPRHHLPFLENRAIRRRVSELVFAIFLPLKDKSIDIATQYLCFHCLISMLSQGKIYSIATHFQCFYHAKRMLSPSENFVSASQ